MVTDNNVHFYSQGIHWILFLAGHKILKISTYPAYSMVKYTHQFYFFGKFPLDLHLKPFTRTTGRVKFLCPELKSQYCFDKVNKNQYSHNQIPFQNPQSKIESLLGSWIGYTSSTLKSSKFYSPTLLLL